ncbi:unnamed protein product [Effrenium voratum]|nr:unnamed protein product [Effrenium voratum]CAJ1418489.1 unnamed protein product [Effrenium voratum]
MSPAKPTAVQLHILIEGHTQGPPQPFRLFGEDSYLCIGRANDCQVQLTGSGVSHRHCKLILSRKGQDPVLKVHDTSRNGTGVRGCRHVLAGKPFTDLKAGEEEVLHHGSQLLIPAKEKFRGKDTRTVLTIRFVLPDAYDPWTKTGRWVYEEKLGEGGLAVVYKARDVTGPLGHVAVKVSKFRNLPEVNNQNRHIYALHREAQWSIQRLHNSADSRFRAKGAALFARYLEDHTGFEAHGGGDFDALRRRFEHPDFRWAEYSFEPRLAREPYVVIELVDAKLLQSVIEGSSLDLVEKRAITRQCVDSLVYMSRFNAIHRDFRGCNMFLQGRGRECRLKVIDLGFMISAEESQARNPNIAVRCAWQGNKDQRIRFDWAPPEVRTREVRNFGLPGSSFDVFSLGVLVMKLLRGRSWTQEVLNGPDPVKRLASLAREVQDLNLKPELFYRMLDHEDAGRRPTPAELSHVDVIDLEKTKRRIVLGAPAVPGALQADRGLERPLAGQQSVLHAGANGSNGGSGSSGASRAHPDVPAVRDVQSHVKARKEKRKAERLDEPEPEPSMLKRRKTPAPQVPPQESFENSSKSNKRRPSDSGSQGAKCLKSSDGAFPAGRRRPRTLD